MEIYKKISLIGGKRYGSKNIGNKKIDRNTGKIRKYYNGYRNKMR